MWTLQEEFARIEIGQASQIRNLKLFPLIRRNASQPLDYLLLEDGIAQGKVRVTELSGGGSVPELSITNTAELPVLLVDGEEELVGAKQNRVLNYPCARQAYDGHPGILCRGGPLVLGQRGPEDSRSHDVLGGAWAASFAGHPIHAVEWLAFFRSGCGVGRTGGQGRPTENSITDAGHVGSL